MVFRISTFGALVMGGLLSLPQFEVVAASRELEAEHGWARASAPGQAVSAGYLELRNPTRSTETIIGATSQSAVSVEIHNTALENGVMRMRAIQRLTLPAGSTVRLAPGGQHLMLKGLRRPLLPGQTITVRLQLASGRSLNAELVVRSPNANRQERHHRHEHD